MKRFILFILILVSCQNEDIIRDINYDSIVFGHFYGFCVGEECVEIFKLTNTGLYEDTIDNYPPRDEAYIGNFQLLSPKLFEKVKDLKSKVPSQLLETPSGIIGQPDAGDWGGIYFEITIDDEKKYWFIDKMRSNIPNYLNPFVDQIEAKIELINQ